jgi:hypothetical protein
MPELDTIPAVDLASAALRAFAIADRDVARPSPAAPARCGKNTVFSGRLNIAVHSIPAEGE